MRCFGGVSTADHILFFILPVLLAPLPPGACFYWYSFKFSPFLLFNIFDLYFQIVQVNSVNGYILEPLFDYV